MVKGITKQVVVVKAPDPQLFEQAIFLVRPEAVEKGGVTDEALLQQAEKAAGRYIHTHIRRPKTAAGIMFLTGALTGGTAVGLIWMITRLVGM